MLQQFGLRSTYERVSLTGVAPIPVLLGLARSWWSLGFSADSLETQLTSYLLGEPTESCGNSATPRLDSWVRPAFGGVTVSIYYYTKIVKKKENPFLFIIT